MQCGDEADPMHGGEAYRMRAASSADLSEASRAPDAARWRCSLSAASLDVASCTAICARVCLRVCARVCDVQE
eukprot:1155968-Pelagomonas_calceolata.AAC.7